MTSSRSFVFAEPVRTAIGTFGGNLKEIPGALARAWLKPEQGAARSRRALRSSRSVLAFVLIVVGAGVGALYEREAGPPPAAAAPPLPEVNVSPPRQETLARWAEFTGQFSAVDVVELRAQVSGYLTEIHFTDGQAVHKGDLLFVIDRARTRSRCSTHSRRIGRHQLRWSLRTSNSRAPRSSRTEISHRATSWTNVCKRSAGPLLRANRRRRPSALPSSTSSSRT
jgi:hypothetical protein